jgi:hypothetical protein
MSEQPCICCGPKEATIIEVGPLKVGLVDLRQILRTAFGLGLSDEGHLTTELLKLARVDNYIAPTWETRYEEALLREYRRFVAEHEAVEK